MINKKCLECANSKCVEKDNDFEYVCCLSKTKEELLNEISSTKGVISREKIEGMISKVVE